MRAAAWVAAKFPGTRARWCGIRGLEGSRPTLIARLLDNRVVGGQIGVIGCCGKTRLLDGRISEMQDTRLGAEIGYSTTGRRA